MKQIFYWFYSLFKVAQPQQSNTGSGTVQARNLQGDVQVNNVTNHIHISALPKTSSNSTPQAQHKARPDQAAAFSQFKQSLTDAERSGAQAMMQREFGTTTIISLDQQQIIRLVAYMDKCIQNRKPLQPSRSCQSVSKKRA